MKYKYKGYSIGMDFKTKKITCEKDDDFITFYPKNFASTLEEIKIFAFGRIDDRINYLNKR